MKKQNPDVLSAMGPAAVLARNRAIVKDNPSPRYGVLNRLVNMALVLVCLLMSFQVAASEPVRVLMLGDSLTAGYGLVKGQSVPAQLDAALKADGLDVSVINAGVSGDTSAGGRARLGWAMADAPDVLIVGLGANDGLRGLDPKDTSKNLEAIIIEGKKAGARVLLLGMLAPPNLGPEYGAEFNRIYPDLAQKNDVALYPFFLEGVVADPQLNQADGIHPNPQGVATIVRNIMPIVKEVLETARN